MTAEHTDTYYTTDFTTVDYTISSTPATTPEQTTTRKFVTSEHTEALATSEQTETPDTSEKTEVLELVTSGHTDTAPSFNTQAEIESRETTSESVCLANSVVITVCTLLSLTFLFGVICGLIADRCVCALLKRKEKQQSKVSLRTERSVKMDHYVMGETAEEITADIYDEITPDCKPA